MLSGWVGGGIGREPPDLTFQVRDLGPFSSSGNIALISLPV